MGELFSYVDLEERVPKNHPLRLIRGIVNEVLALDREFAELYAAEGRPSIAPERLLRALLLQAFYTIRSERQLMEQLHYNLLYRWFVGLGVDDPVWVPTVFTKNRDRLLEAEVARKFLAELLAHKEVRALLSDEHFSVDGTQIAAWASMKSFVTKDGSDEPPSPGRNGERDFHGDQRVRASCGHADALALRCIWTTPFWKMITRSFFALRIDPVVCPLCGVSYGIRTGGERCRDRGSLR
jgi:transposase